MGLYFDEEEALKELRDRGYRVVKEDYDRVGNIRSSKQVIEWFYARRMFYHPDRKYPPSGINYKEDTKPLSVYLRKREKTGLNRQTALKEAAMLIETMFKYEQHLGLKEPIMSLRIMTQDGIMDRVCAFANGEVPLVEEEKDHAFIDEINKVYNRENAERDKQLAAERMDKIMEILHGEERGRGETDRRNEGD